MENRKQYDINLHTFIHCNLDLHTGGKKKWNLYNEIFTKDN